MGWQDAANSDCVSSLCAERVTQRQCYVGLVAVVCPQCAEVEVKQEMMEQLSLVLKCSWSCWVWSRMTEIVN